MSAPLTSGVSPPQYSPGSWRQKNRTYNEQRQRVMRMYGTLWNDLRDITVAVQRLINVEHEWTVAPSMLVSEPRVPQREHKLVSSYMYLLHFLTFCLFYFLYYKGRCVLISDKWPTERSQNMMMRRALRSSPSTGSSSKRALKEISIFVAAISCSQSIFCSGCKPLGPEEVTPGKFWPVDKS